MYTKGSSIIEIIIALAVLTFGITAGTLLAFSNQSIELDTQTASEALYITKDAIENVRATAQGDFSEIASLEITQSIDIYTNQIFALNSDCSKRVTSLTTWQTDAQRDKYISLTTEIADMTEALALGGGCTGFPGDEWYHPDTSNVANTNPASARGTGVDVAKINGRAYAFVTSDISGSSQDDFWAFDVEDVTQTTAPTKMTSLDTGLGLVDIAVAKQEGGGRPLGQFTLHRWEHHKKAFSFSYFHVLMKGPGLTARRKLNLTEGQLLHPENAVMLFLAFLIEKTKERAKHADRYFPIWEHDEDFAKFYNGGKWKEKNPDYLVNLERYYQEADAHLDEDGVNWFVKAKK